MVRKDSIFHPDTTLPVKVFDRGFYAYSFLKGWGPWSPSVMHSLVYARVGEDTLRLTDRDLSVLVSVDQEHVWPLARRLRVWPNPAHSQVKVSFSSTVPARIEAHDALGRLMMQQQVAGGTSLQQVSIDVASWPAGIYFARLVAAGGVTQVALFVVQR